MERTIAKPDERLRPLGFVTLAICALFSLPLGSWIIPGSGISSVIAREALFWVITASIVLYVVRIEKQTLASIGWRRPSIASVGFGLLGAVAAFAGMAFIYLVILPHLDPSYASKTSTIAALPIALKIAIVIRAAIFEETFYRGFMIERLRVLFGSRAIAAAVSWAAFTAAHISYWGWASLLLAGLGGAVLTILYLWRRDLASNILAHGLTDAIALLV